MDLDVSKNVGQRSLGAAEAEIDRFIAKRAEKGERDVDEVDELWKASTEREQERQREQNRWGWVRHFDLMAANHAKLAEEYERRAEELCEGPQENGQAKLKGEA